MPMPASDVPAGHMQPLGVDRARAIFDAMGLGKGYEIALPTSTNGVYTAVVTAGPVGNTRIVHIDQYTGEVLGDFSFSDFGIGAQAIEWSISVHIGDQYGLINQLLMLAACIAIVLMSVAAVVMWWKRRPAGELGVPPAPGDKRTARTVLAIIAVGGVLFPLVGLSIAAALVVDWLLVRGKAITVAFVQRKAA